MKKNIILVGHDTDIAGASHYLYMLYNVLKKKYTDLNIYLCLPFPNNNKEYQYNYNIQKKHDIHKHEILEYDYNPSILKEIYDKYNPVLMYLNSCNKVYIDFYNSITDKQSIIIHSHETRNEYIRLLNNNYITPDIVVTKEIATDYLNNEHRELSVQPPFIENINKIIELSNEIVEDDIVKSHLDNFDENKITFGMCGNLTERKNINLFKMLCKDFSQYNFLWIGGHRKSKMCDVYKNFFHIPNINNPYKYFKKYFDYFLLTSLSDPCPYVILENILLETNIITFKENIHYHHNNDLINDFYFQQNGYITFEKCAELLSTMNFKKKSQDVTGNGYKYILNNFSSPNEIFKLIDKIF